MADNSITPPVTAPEVVPSPAPITPPTEDPGTHTKAKKKAAVVADAHPMEENPYIRAASHQSETANGRTDGGVDPNNPYTQAYQGRNSVLETRDVSQNMDSNKEINADKDMHLDMAAQSTLDKDGTFIKDGKTTQAKGYLDNSTWLDRFLGRGDIRNTRTLDYANGNPASQKEVADRRFNDESKFGIIPGFNLATSAAYNQTVMKPYQDPETGKISMQEFTPKDQNDYNNAISAYGAKTPSQLFLRSFAEGVGDLIGNTPKDVIGLAQAFTHLVNPKENTLLDRISDHMNQQAITNRNPGSADEDNGLSSLAGISKGLGSGVASLMQFGGYSKVAGLVGNSAKFFASEKAIEIFSRLGGAGLMSMGPAYTAAKDAGLKGREASVMALGVGLIDGALQESVGSNLVAKYFAGGGASEIPKIVLEEIKSQGGAISEESLNKASGNIFARAYKAIDGFQKKVTAIPIAGPALEQAVQMGVQSAVNSTGEMWYNSLHESDPNRTTGKGYYTHMSNNEIFTKAFSTAGSAAILGGVMGFKLNYDKQAEETTIHNSIVRGDAGSVLRSVDWMVSDGKISKEQGDAYKERVVRLDNLYNKNKGAFDKIKNPLEQQVAMAQAIGEIDKEFEIKNNIKKAQTELVNIHKQFNDPDVSQTVVDSGPIKAKQDEIDLHQRELKQTQERLKNFVPDKDGKIPFSSKIEILNNFKTNFINNKLNPTVDQLPYVNQFINNELTKIGSPLKDFIDNLYQEKLNGKSIENLTEQYSNKFNTLLRGNDTNDSDAIAIKNTLEERFRAHVKLMEDIKATGNEDLTTRIKDTKLYNDDTLSEMLNNPNLTDEDKISIKKEQSARSQKEKDKNYNIYDAQDPINKDIFKKTIDHPNFESNLQDFSTPHLKNLLKHAELSSNHIELINTELNLRNGVTTRIEKELTRIATKEINGEQLTPQEINHSETLAVRYSSILTELQNEKNNTSTRQETGQIQGNQGRQQEGHITGQEANTEIGSEKSNQDKQDELEIGSKIIHDNGKKKVLGNIVSIDGDKYTIKLASGKDDIVDKSTLSLFKPKAEEAPVVKHQLGDKVSFDKDGETIEGVINGKGFGKHKILGDDGINYSKPDKELTLVNRPEDLSDVVGGVRLPTDQDNNDNISENLTQENIDKQLEKPVSGVNKKIDFIDLLGGEQNDNVVGGLSIQATPNFIAYLSNKYEDIKSDVKKTFNKSRTITTRSKDVYTEEGFLIQNPHNGRIESPHYYNPGTVITLKKLTFEENNQNTTNNVTREEFDAQQADYAISNVGIFGINPDTKEREFLGHYPTFQKALKTRGITPDHPELLKLAENRRKLTADGELELNSTILKKSAGYLNLNRKSQNDETGDIEYTHRPYYDALGDGTKLPEDVRLLIGQNSEAMIAPKRSTEKNDVNAEVKDGYVYSELTRSDGSTILAPMKISALGPEKGSIVYRLVLALLQPAYKEKIRESTQGINLDSYASVTDAIKSIMYAQSKANTSLQTEEHTEDDDEKDTNVFYIDLHYPNPLWTKGSKVKPFTTAIITSAESDGRGVFLRSELLNSNTKGNRVEEFTNLVANRYHAVRLRDINIKDKKYRSLSLDENDNIKMVTHNSYEDYLNTDKILTTNVQGFPTHEGSNRYNYTSQPSITIDGNLSESVKDPVLKETQANLSNIEDEDDDIIGSLKPVVKKVERNIRPTRIATEKSPDTVKRKPIDLSIGHLEVNVPETKNKSLDELVDHEANKDATNLMFVNIDDFTSGAQGAIIDSMAHLIHTTYLTQGIKNSENLLSTVYNIMSAKYETLLKTKGKEDLADVYGKILDNYDRFEDFTIKKLAGMGIDLNGDIKYKDDVPNNEELDNPEKKTKDIDFASATHSRTNYEEDYQFSESALNKSSSKIRAMLSFIPRSETDANGNMVLDENGLIKPLINKLDMKSFLPVTEVWNSLIQQTFDLLPEEILNHLQTLAKINPMYKQVVDAMSTGKDQQLVNEFVTLLSKQQARFVRILVDSSDDNTSRSLKVIDANRSKTDDIIAGTWLEAFRNNKTLVKEDNKNNLYVDTKVGEEIYDRYFNAIEGKNHNIPEDKVDIVNAMIRAMGDMGIEVNDKFFNHMVENGVNFQGRKVKFRSFYKGGFAKILESLLDINDKGEIQTIDPDASMFDAHNPFIQEKAGLKALASLYAAANTQIYESSFVDGNGKAKYSYVNNSYLSQIYKEIMRGTIATELLSVPYSADSMWLKNIERLRDGFKLEYLDTFGSQNNQTRNKSFKSMNEKDKEMTRSALFQNSDSQGFGKYLMPIPGDKTMMPVLTAFKIDVGLDYSKYGDQKDGFSGKRLLMANHDAVDKLYNVFLSEYNRIQKVKSINADPNFADRLLKGYHYGKEVGDGQGMGEKYFSFRMFNDNKQVEKDGVINEEYIRKSIIDFMSDAIKEQEQNWSKLGLINYKKPHESLIFDKSRKDVKDNNNAIPQYAADYIVNQFLFNHNYMQVIGGDPALHAKGNIDETLINYNKRTVKDIAPGTDPMFKSDGDPENPQKKTMNVMFLKDIIGTSDLLSNYAHVLENHIGGEGMIEAYKDINSTDAQEYTTLKEHLAVLGAQGKLTPEIKEAAFRLMNGSNNPQSIKAVLSVMKPIYVGDKIQSDLGVAAKYYFKTSSFPLIPALTVNNPALDALRIHMETNNIDRAIYESGVKLGLESNSTEMNYKNDLTMTPINLADAKIHSLDRRGFRIQQDIPFHGPGYAIEGTQVRKLINGNMDSSKKTFTMGKLRSPKEALNIFEALHARKIDLNWNTLKTDFGIEQTENGIVKINDVSKFQNLLMKEALDRGYATNEIVGLNLVVDPKTGETNFKLPLNFNSASNKFEAIMNSIFTNRVINQKLPGTSSVQASGAGFRISDHINESIKSDIIYIDPKDTKLNYFKFNEDKTNDHAEILIPSYFKDPATGKMIDLVKMGVHKISPEMLNLFGYRIPTQGLNSMMTFKVKGFLPSYMGDMVVVPGEITAQMGSDFDVDKMFIHNFNYTYDKINRLGKYNIDKVPILDDDQLQNISSQNDHKAIENTILQHYMDKFTHADLATAGQILETNSSGKLGELNKEIQEIIQKENNNGINNYLLPMRQNQIHSINVDGLAGKGIFSLYSVFLPTAIANHLSLASKVEFDVKDDARSDLYGFNTINAHGAYTSSVISFLQTASVDNAKLQYLSGLNINPITMDVAGLIAASGYDESHISYFLSQHAVRDYVDTVANGNDIFDTAYDPNKLGKSINKIALEYTKAIGMPDYDNFYGKVINNELHPSKSYSLDEMKAELKDPTVTAQLDFLKQFIRLKEQAKAVSNVISATNINTKGIGSTYVELESNINEIDNLDEKSSNPLRNVSNTEALFDPKSGDTIISKTSDLARKMYDAVSKFFPYSNNGYKQIKQTLKQQGGAVGEFTNEYLKDLYGHINSYILSNTELTDSENITDLRNRLFFDTPNQKSLGTRTTELRKEYPSNALLQRLNVKGSDKTDDPTEIYAQNIPSAVKSDNIDEALRSFTSMYKSDDPKLSEYAKDLIKYYLTTGAKFSPTSISRFIPLDILDEATYNDGKEKYDFSRKLRKVTSDLNDDANFFGNMPVQYYQHNPLRALRLNVDDINTESIKKRNNTIVIGASNNKYAVIKFNNDDGIQYKQFPSYLSFFDKASKKWQLYGLTHVDDKDQIDKPATFDHSYERINLLGKPNFTEYQFVSHDGENEGNKPVESMLSKNILKDGSFKPIVPGIPFSDRDVKNLVEVKDRTSYDELVHNLGLEKGKSTTFSDVLNNIMKMPFTTSDSSNRLKTIASELSHLIKPGLNVNINTDVDANGWYHPYEGVTINPSWIVRDPTTNSTEKSIETILHEGLHSVIDDQFTNPEELSPEKRVYFDNVKKMFDQYTKDTNNNEASSQTFKKFLDINSKITKLLQEQGSAAEMGNILSKEEAQFWNQNRAKYYGLTSIKEFVTEGLSGDLSHELSSQNKWRKLFNNVMNMFGFSYKNDWEALLHNVLKLNDRNSDYKFGTKNADEITSKDNVENNESKTGNQIKSPEESSVAKEIPTKRPIKKLKINTEGNEDYENIDKAQQFHNKNELVTPEEAKTRLLNTYKSKENGILPSNVDFEALNNDIASYNKDAGYDALELRKKDNGDMYVASTKGNSYSIGEVNVDKKSKREQTIEDMVSRLNADIGRLELRGKSSSNKDVVDARIMFNKSRIKELQKAESLKDLYDISSVQIDHAFENLKNKVLGIHSLDEMEATLNIFTSISQTTRLKDTTDENKAYNKKLDDIHLRKEAIDKMIKTQKFNCLVNASKTALDLPEDLDYNSIVNGVQTDVGSYESLFLPGSRSSSKYIRLAAAFIRHSGEETTRSLLSWKHDIDNMFNEHLKTNKNYDSFLQMDDKGNPTGHLISEYNHGYRKALNEAYQADQALGKGNKHENYWKFVRDNNNLVISPEAKKRYMDDLDNVKKNNPMWQTESSRDHARFNSFVKNNSPDAWIESVKSGKQPDQRFAYNYVKQSPKGQWKDSRFDQLMSKGVDSPEVKLYQFIADEFEKNNRKYGNKYSPFNIPEVSKSLVGFLAKGDIKGAFNGIKEGTLSSIMSSVDPLIKENQVDPVTGRLYNTIPIYMMSDQLNPSQKTYDLRTVLYKTKEQDFSIQHKQNIEPYLNYLHRNLTQAAAYQLNNAGQIQDQKNVDENGDISHVIKPTNGNVNALSQLEFMMDTYLYNKGSKTSGVMAPKNPKIDIDEEGNAITENTSNKRYFTVSKAADALNSLTRSTGLVFNVGAGINNLTFGMLCNVNYGASGKFYTMGHAVSAWGDMLSGSIPGSVMQKKIEAFNEMYNVINTINEIKYSNIKGKNVEDPTSNFNWYWMSEKGESLIQGHLAVSMAKGYKIGENSNLWDSYSYDSTTGKLKWISDEPNPHDEGHDDKKANASKRKFMRDIKTSVFLNHGNYEEPIQIKKFVLGRLLMTYKTWMPELINAKYGPEKTDLDGTVEKGQLRSLFGPTLLKGKDGEADSYGNIGPNLIASLLNGGKASILAPIDRQNIRRLAAEAITTGSLMAIALGLSIAVTKNEDKSAKANLIFLLNIMNRNVSDMNFQFNASSLSAVVKTPFPVVQTVQNYGNIIVQAYNQIMGAGNYKNGVNVGQNPLTRAIIKAVPAVNTIQKIKDLTHKQQH